MGLLRISFGNASVKNFSSSSPSLVEVCAVVNRKVSYLKSLKKEQLEKWAEAETEEISVGGKTGTLTVFKDKISEQKDLVIVQAFYPTLASPNYLAIGRIGRIFVEGFYIDAANNISDAEDTDLWRYR